MLAACWRAVLMIGCATGYFFYSWNVPANPGRAAHRSNLVNLTRWCRRGLRILGIQVRIKHRPASHVHSLQISNHLSYVDAIALAAVRPSLFITSQEVAADPVLGRFSRAGGCDFVERRSLRTLVAECERLGKHLQHASLMLFPEATSSDGTGLLPFKPAFFNVAKNLAAPLQPIALRYTRIGGRRFSRSTHRWVCWYGDMSFLPHALHLLTIPRIEVVIDYLDLIDCDAYPDRKQLSQHAHRVISEAYTALERE